MEFITLSSNTDEKTLTKVQALSLCHRGLGQDIQVKSIQELAGGTFNATFLVTLEVEAKFILRVGPSATTELYWDDVLLMRREYQIRPFFAAIDPMMPRIQMIDFTHQLIDRDYMFQSYLEGERWDEIEEELTEDENLELWKQLGQLVKVMHSTQGERFGWPYPGPQFDSWSELVINRFDRIRQSMEQEQLEVGDFKAISEIVQSHRDVLDEIRRPYLLHGDLWLFNILIKQGEGGPKIVGILDVDRAWWGDPMADLLMFLLSVRRKESEWELVQRVFWSAYGREEQSKKALFREEVYNAMHFGSASVWCLNNGDLGGVRQAKEELSRLVQVIPALVG